MNDRLTERLNAILPKIISPDFLGGQSRKATALANRNAIHPSDCARVDRNTILARSWQFSVQWKLNDYLNFNGLVSSNSG